MKTAINIALKNGFDPKPWVGDEDEFIAETMMDSYPLELIIFNLDFAKALAGTESVCIECGKPYDREKLACTSCLCGAWNEEWEVFLTRAAYPPTARNICKPT